MSRYQIIRELGRNHEGGRITYLATDTHLDSPQQVVIKEFRFAASGANWSSFKAYQREIEILRELKHPRIPHYLDSFETKSGFCLVQEYKNALSLAVRRSFTPEDIKKIAVSVLEILVYLQKRTPPVIHRDIKPENILVDKELNAYLVDFGFARIRSGELALSSVAAGTPGFMPPEEQFGRPLTEASDLYSLGATIICLLTGTRSLDIGNLIDDNYRFDFKKLVPKLNRRFITWLEKMVEPNVKQRYRNAAVALEVLQPIQVVGNSSSLEMLFRAIKPKIKVLVVGLATLAFIPLFGRNWLIPRDKITLIAETPTNNVKQDNVKQLLETRRCPGCYLGGAMLGGAVLWSAYLDNADLSGAELRSANLWAAHIEGANLNGVHLMDASLLGASLQGSSLHNADLENANLKSANLRNANLEGAFLENANLKDANLKNANLTNARLKGTIMPDGSKHP